MEAGHEDREGSKGRNLPTRPLAAAAKGKSVADIVALILADHARMRGLFAALDGAAGREEHPGTPGMLSQAWARLTGLLELHTAAEEKICYPALFGCRQHTSAELNAAIADHNEIREAVHEARLLDAGSEAWWRTATAVHRTTSDHLASEEQGVLADFRRHGPPALRDALGRQWATLTTVRNYEDPMRGVALIRIGSHAELDRIPWQR